MAVIFKIDGKSVRCEGEIIAIGRSPSNQVALPDDTRLAPVHAVLRLVSGRWIVESREGGPIRVGTGRPTQFAWLNANDVIHLTESGPDMTFIPEPAAAAAPTNAAVAPPVAVPVAVRPEYVVPQPATPDLAPSCKVARAPVGVASNNASEEPEQPAPTAMPHWVLYSGLGGLAATVLIAVGAFLGSDRRPAPAPVAAAKAPVEPPAPIPVVTNVPTAPATPAAKVAADDPRNGVYRLELRTADRSKSMQLGTAWAVAPRRLVTTGDAARGISANQQDFPLPVVCHSSTGKEFEVSGVILHPQYAAANGKAERATGEIERLLPELDGTLKPDERKQIIDLLHSHDREVINARDEATNVNLATLEVTQDLPSLLSWEPTPPPKIGQQLTLIGHPFSATYVLVDPDHPTPLQQHIGRLQYAETVRTPVLPSRYLVRFSAPLTGENWSGSPVLNTAGKVVGVYVCATRSPPGEPPPTIATHDVTVIDGVRDWLPEAINPTTSK